MKVYSDRNNILVEIIRLRKNIDFIAVAKVQVGQQFGLIAIREVSPPFGEDRSVHCGRNFFSS